MRYLPLLALLPLPLAAADDLTWHVQVATVSKYAPVEFSAQLRNVSKGSLAFEAEGERPALELILEQEGKPAARKPLPKEAVAYKGPKELPPSEYAWFVSGDLRHAFGRLPPGKYTLRVSGGGTSEPASFEVLDTSLEEAKKAWKGPEGVEFRVKAPGVGVLVNRRKTPIGLWAYGGDRKDQPLDAMATAQQWTGRAFEAFAGGFCGTGLEEVTVAPGGEREIALPALPDGILRLFVPCFERRGEKAVQIEALTEPFLVDTFK
ncbi:MAG TPA: hypothetical protein VFY93_00210 [Planctomycetota bacterium]|nr:hypothetical protein [Planctomycetota bacterium]